jgi:hypothetical protein
MTTFYVLASRHQLGQRYCDILGSLFPDTAFSPWDWADLGESVAALIEAQGDACVVYREDMAEDLSVKESLLRDFGAALDDEIIEIYLGAGLTQFGHQRWSTESPRRAA